MAKPEHPPSTGLSQLVEDLRRGDHRAVARGISLVENEAPAARDLQKRLFQHSGGAYVVGITGSPGSGKSTLVDRLIEFFRRDDRRLGVLAVDPSSPFTGGAVLGDRIRMMRHSPDPEVYIRSMATRGHLGGLSRAVGPALTVLEAAGFDRILIETVGVGQDEVDVIRYADAIVVVLTPGSGDEIQTFKAGIMEIADIFVLNKADTSEADRTENLLNAMLDLGGKAGDPRPPVIRTVATDGEGIDLLYREIERIAGEAADSRRGRRRAQAERMLMDAIWGLVHTSITGILPEGSIQDLVDRISAKELDPVTAAEQVFRDWKENNP